MENKNRTEEKIRKEVSVMSKTDIKKVLGLDRTVRGHSGLTRKELVEMYIELMKK